MCTIIVSILSSIIVGAIASFIVWIIPAEKFDPQIKLVCYNQKVVEDSVKDSNGEESHRKLMKRNVQIVNHSPKFAAYNITCFAELLDENNNIVYREEQKLPIIKANIMETDAIVLSFARLPLSKLKKENVIKIEFNLVFENRYGTKKTSGPWWVKEYDTDTNSFITTSEK